MRMFLFSMIACCLFSLTTACAPIDRFFWPLPPEQPKIEFIGVYSGDQDLPGARLSSLTGDIVVPLSQPTAVVSDGRGKVYVAEGIKNRIVIFDFTSGKYTEFDNQFQMPFGLAIDSKENLYVVERKSSEVRVFNAKQEFLFRFGQGILVEPLRIAIDEKHERIYVSDRTAHQVKVFTLQGKFIQSIGIQAGGDADGAFYRPFGVAVDRVGNLYVCDQLNARIQVFDSSGAFVRKFGLRGDQLDNFESPAGLTFDNLGQLWVVDVRKAALLTYNVSGSEAKFLYATYGPGAAPGRYSFVGPVDISIDKDNRIYVADSLGRRFSVLQYLDSAYQAQHPLPANWLQRTDTLEIWYKDSGMTPPPKEDVRTPKKP